MKFTYLGNYVAKKRKEIGVSQFTLAKDSGLSMSTIQHIEYGIGTMNVTIKTLIKLSIAFNISFLKFLVDSELLKDFAHDDVFNNIYTENSDFIESNALSNESTNTDLSILASCPSERPFAMNP